MTKLTSIHTCVLAALLGLAPAICRGDDVADFFDGLFGNAAQSSDDFDDGPQQQDYVEGQQYYLQDGRLAVFRNGQFIPIDQGTQPTAAPTPPLPPPPVPKPDIKTEPNPLALNIRAISAAEISRGKQTVCKALGECLDDLESALEPSLIDEAVLIEELARLNADATVQTRLIQAIRSGKATEAQLEYVTLTKDVTRGQQLHHQIATATALAAFREAVEAKEVVAAQLRTLRKAIQKGSAEQARQKPVVHALSDLERLMEVSESLSTAQAGKSGDLAVGAASTKLIMNPQLPAGVTIGLGNGSVLVGTGGVGELEAKAGDLSELLGYQVFTAAAISNAPEVNIDGIVLVNPSTTKTPVIYEFNAKQERLESGQQVRLPVGAKYNVKFNRGGTFGWQTYGLDPGTYEFKGTAKGWELFAKSYEVVIDNSRNKTSFQFVYDGEARVVQASDKLAIKSKFPITLKFDRGNGAKDKKVVLTGTKEAIVVGLQLHDRQWDLFPQEVVNAKGSAVVEAGKSAF